MNERTRDITVGMTALAGLVGLGVLLFLFGYVPAFLKGGYFIQIEMNEAVALNEGSQVQLFGINVGQVKSVEFRQPRGSGILVFARIKDGIEIPADSHAEVDTDLLGGTAVVQIVPNGDAKTHYAEVLPMDGTAVIPGELGSLAGAFSQLNRLANSFDSLSGEWRRVGENINTLLEGGNGEQDASIPDVVKGLEARLDELKLVLDGARKYTDNVELYENVNATVANARTVSERAVKVTDETKALIGNAEQRMDDLSKRYLAVAEETTATLSQMQQVLQEILEGKGTAGKMLRDPELFDNWAALAERIGALADEARLMVEKWKAEGLPVQF